MSTTDATVEQITLEALQARFPSIDAGLVEMMHSDCRGNKMECVNQLMSFGPMEGSRQASGGSGSDTSPLMLVSSVMEDAKVSPDLERDVGLAKALGIETEVKVATGIRMTISVSVADVVSEGTSRAWGFSRSLPFAIQLVFDSNLDYLECGRPPQVSVTQAGQPCRYGQQIKAFLEHYLQANWTSSGWQKKGGGVSQVSPSTSTTMTKEERSVTTTSTDSKSGWFQSACAALSKGRLMILETLQGMGFSKEVSLTAAQDSKSVEEAVEKCVTGKAIPRPIEHQQYMNESIVEGERKLASFIKSDVSLNEKDDPNKYVEYRPQEEGFLVHLAFYVRHRTLTAHHYCVICDQPHLMGSGMLKACVCERELCSFQFHELSLGKDAADNVAMGAGVMDLLIATFRNAVMCTRCEQVCSPYPSVPDPQHPGILALNPAKKDFIKLKSLVGMLPNTGDIIGMKSIDRITQVLTHKDPLLTPLLNWVVESNRSHIVRLGSDEILHQMGTPHQFYISSDSPERQAKFAKAKAKANEPEPLLMFHGTSSANIFSILNNGLIIQKGACQELWMAREASTSVGYMYRDGESASTLMNNFYANPTQKKKNTNGGDWSTVPEEANAYFDGTSHKDFAAMLLLEVSHRAAWAQGSQQAICTVANPDHVSVRMIYFFTKQEHIQTAQAQGKTDDKKFLADVKKIMKKYE